MLTKNISLFSIYYKPLKTHKSVTSFLTFWHLNNENFSLTHQQPQEKTGKLFNSKEISDDQVLNPRDKSWKLKGFFFSFVSRFTHQKHLTKSICMRASLAKKREDCTKVDSSTEAKKVFILSIQLSKLGLNNNKWSLPLPIESSEPGNIQEHR